MQIFHWNKMSLVSKMVLQLGIIASLLFVINLGFYVRLNSAMQTLDNVYSSNVDMTALSESFADVQDNMYLYLKVKSSDSLRDYYQSEARYREMLETLNEQNIDSTVMLLEKTIRRMSETYLTYAADTVSAKRARNVEKYKNKYDETLQLYQYIESEIAQLNSYLFTANNDRYESLRAMLRYLEMSNTILMLVIVVGGIMFLFFSTRDMVRPLSSMAATARLVGEGNFHIKMPAADAQDELGTVTIAFNKMVENLDLYMEQTRQGMEKEQKMIERELLMEAHLKEAQLTFLQSQINPHFLFNSLNAGVQLAMIEDAEKTGIFLEKMADFFRYNVKKGQEDATLLEEMEAVDSYVYILNVRFTGDIHVTKDIDTTVDDTIRMPSMILQPIVENAVNHGIRDIDWEGHILIWVCPSDRDGYIEIGVQDNGIGMTQEQIRMVMGGSVETAASVPADTAMQNLKEGRSSSTGVGMKNVISRLELYYSEKDLLRIYSEGSGQGTRVILTIPMQRSGEHV